MAPAAVEPSHIDVTSGQGGYELAVSVDLADSGALRLGLSAVIAEADGRMAYWALAHPAGRPDFHHPDCFALDLPAPVRP
jgi:hypothetical protein